MSPNIEGRDLLQRLPLMLANLILNWGFLNKAFVGAVIPG